MSQGSRSESGQNPRSTQSGGSGPSGGTGQSGAGGPSGGAAQSGAKGQSAAAAPEPPHQRFQSASERYFTDVNAVWSDTQRRVQELQLDFLRGQVELGHAQPPLDAQGLQKEYQALQEKFQKEFENLANDAEPAKRLAKAYVTFRDSVRKELADLAADALDPVTLGLIAQTTFAVAQCAEQIRQSLERSTPTANAA